MFCRHTIATSAELSALRPLALDCPHWNVDRMPNQSPEPTAARAVGLSGRRRLVDVTVRLWLSFVR